MDSVTTSEKLKTHVQDSFNRLRKALDVRQKLLLRQIDVVFNNQNQQNAHQQHHLQLYQQKINAMTNTNDESAQHPQQQKSPAFNSNNINNIEFINENELDVLNSIRKYGRYNFEHYNIVLNDMIFQNQNEDDHHHNDYDLLMHKSCINIDEGNTVTPTEPPSDNVNIIKENADYINDSIINITLNETKELIDQTTNNKTETPSTPPIGTNQNAIISVATNMHTTNEASKEIVYTNQNAIRTTRINNFENKDKMKIDLTNIYDDGDTEHDGMNKTTMHNSKSSQTELLSRSNTLRNISNLSLTNYNGIINLKNISNVTITNSNKLPKKEINAVDSKKLLHNYEITKRSYSSSDGFNKSAANSKTGVLEFAAEKPEEDVGDTECMFYKRLISENKILKNHIVRSSLLGENMVSDSSSTINPYANPHHYNQKVINLPLRLNTSSSNKSSTGSNSCSTSNISTSASGITSVLNQNIPATDVDISAGSSATGIDAIAAGPKPDDVEQQQHVQQWLKQIIYETEIEPLQQTNILEFSHEVNG